jgi:hypothetical protein
MTFMALVDSLQNVPKRAPTIRPARPRPECLNGLTSLLADTFQPGRHARMIAPRTASQITAGAGPNDYQ